MTPTSPSPETQPSWRQIPDRWVKRGVIVLLATLAVIAIAPAYLTGQWPWVTAPQVSQIEQLKPLLEEGLALPGWQLIHHQVITINKQDWGLNEYTALEATDPVPQMAVLLHPQPWHSNQPQVEWVDLIGAQNWRVDGRQRLTLKGDAGASLGRANFFRGWSDRQAFAVLQWYAWPGGGHPAPGRWFWANQRSQLTRHTLTPWVAITVLAPIAPLDDLRAHQPLMIDLGGQVHQRVVAALPPGP
jgi:cyanoexosortase B-associated protein